MPVRPSTRPVSGSASCATSGSRRPHPSRVGSRASGCSDLFDAWSFSDESGWFKPAAEAFEPALLGLGADPAEAAHVGDNERTDIAGAKALGMTAVQYTGLFEVAGWLPEQAPGGSPTT